MIRLLTAALLVASFGVVADTEVPNIFTDGTPANAKEVNANFDALEAAIDAIPEGSAGPAGPAGADGEDGVTGPAGPQGEAGPQGPVGLTGATGAKGDQGDTGEQGIQGEQGPAGADGVAAGLSCTTDQIIKWDGSAWVCASRSIVMNTCGGDTSTNVCEALCAEGATVVSGGCNITFWNTPGTIMEYGSYPKNDASGWICRVLHSGSESYVDAFAICQ